MSHFIDTRNSIQAEFARTPSFETRFQRSERLLDTAICRELFAAHGETLGRIAQKAHVAVVYSSNPADHKGIITPAARSRSFKSYQATAEHIADGLSDLGFGHVAVCNDVSLMQQIADGLYPNPDLVWLNTGGVQGRDPMLQAGAHLEAAGVPYIGHRPIAYGVSDDKLFAQDVLRSHGIPTPQSIDVSHAGERYVARVVSHLLDKARHGVEAVLQKPINGRGSIGVERIFLRSYLQEPWRLQRSLMEAQVKYQGIKIDEFMPGDEVTVSVLGTNSDLIVFPPLRRDIDQETGIFASLDVKDVAGRAKVLKQNDNGFSSACETAMRTYDALRLEGLCRVDLRADANGIYNVIDVNPKPDLGTATKVSLSEIAANAQGVDFKHLIALLLLSRIDHGFDRYPFFKDMLGIK